MKDQNHGDGVHQKYNDREGAKYISEPHVLIVLENHVGGVQ